METDHKEHCCIEDEVIAWNPCTSCGACCVAFRASFYWAEGEDTMEGGVPVHLTVNVNAFRRAMRRTNSQDQRCIALYGTPGQRVQCTIYERRPSVCRNFDPSGRQESTILTAIRRGPSLVLSPSSGIHGCSLGFLNSKST
jgi:hypothetical protein